MNQKQRRNKTNVRLSRYLHQRHFLPHLVHEKGTLTASAADLIAAIRANLPAHWKRHLANARNREERGLGLCAIAEELGLLNEKPAPAVQVRKKLQAMRLAVEVASDAFLQSYEWRRVRMEALKKYGARCQCCGASPANGAVLNVDHIKPRKIFPALALDLSNLQVLCGECNHGKGNWDMTDWRKEEDQCLPK